MQRDVELLPCPFCGNKPLLSPKNIEGGQSINCAYCPGLEMYSWIEETDSGHIYMSEDELVKRWNTRTKQPSNLVGLDVEKLTKYLEISDWSECSSKKMAEEICSRFGQRTVELPSVREIENIIRNQPNRHGYYCGNPTTVAEAIHSAMLEKIGEKK